MNLNPKATITPVVCLIRACGKFRGHKALRHSRKIPIARKSNSQAINYQPNYGWRLSITHWIVLLSGLLLLQDAAADVINGPYLRWDGDTPNPNLLHPTTTIGNVRVVPALRGFGYEFNAEGDALEASGLRQLPNPSASLLVKPKPVATSTRFFNLVVERTNNEGLEVNLSVSAQGNSARMSVYVSRKFYANNQWHSVQGSTYQIPSTWEWNTFHHVVFGVDGTVLRLHVDNTFVSEVPIPQLGNIEAYSLTHRLRIGGSVTIDELRLFSQPLNLEDLAVLNEVYTGIDISSALSGWWKFYPNVANPLPDSSPVGRSASLAGGQLNYVQGREGYQFTGAGGVTLASTPSLDPRRGLTVSCVVMNDNDNNWMVPFLSGPFRFSVLNGLFDIRLGEQSVYFGSVGALFTERRWRHVTMTIGDGWARVFVDGNPGPKQTYSGILDLSASELKSLENSKGTVRDLRIWNRTLNSLQVEEAYRSTQVGSISYTISNRAPVPGSLSVQISGILSQLALADPTTGSGRIDLPFSNGLSLIAFQDRNGDGIAGTWEPQFVYSPNPFNINGDLRGVTLPLVSLLDTDGDGMPDVWETANGLNPNSGDATLDKDSDGLSNALEFELNLAANTPDSDGDGVSDATEVSAKGSLGTKTDSDGDGMDDAWEVANDLNPLVNDTAEDRDLDGLSNSDEYAARAQGYRANQRDSDGDGQEDALELRGETWKRALYDRTNRLIGWESSAGLAIRYVYDANSNKTGEQWLATNDTDGDGLPDIWELANGLSIAPGSGTQGPNGAAGDLDGDGFSNAQEWQSKSNPADANDKPSLANNGTPDYAFAQTKPRARILPSPNVGESATANRILVRVWDAEGNPVRLTLQMQWQGSTDWHPATVTRIDGLPVSGSPVPAAGQTMTAYPAASPEGATHELIWNTPADAPPNYAGILFLRVQALDAAWEAGALPGTPPATYTGDWSETTLYYTTAYVDGDRDGMNSEWEILHGFNPSSANDADLDADGDGSKNAQEFQAGTNPHDSTDYFELVMAELTGNFLNLSVKTVAQKVYQLEWATTPAGPWTALPPAILGDGSVKTMSVPVASNIIRRFYRAKVIQP